MIELSQHQRLRTFLISRGQKTREKHCYADFSSWWLLVCNICSHSKMMNYCVFQHSWYIFSWQFLKYQCKLITWVVWIMGVPGHIFLGSPPSPMGPPRPSSGQHNEAQPTTKWGFWRTQEFWRTQGDHTTIHCRRGAGGGFGRTGCAGLAGGGLRGGPPSPWPTR